MGNRISYYIGHLNITLLYDNEYECYVKHWYTIDTALDKNSTLFSTNTYSCHVTFDMCLSFLISNVNIMQERKCCQTLRWQVDLYNEFDLFQSWQTNTATFILIW